MRRITLLVVAVMGGLSACGCGLPGWYRAAGHFPGVAVSDYAFYYFNGTASQLFPNTMPDTEGAAMESSCWTSASRSKVGPNAVPTAWSRSTPRCRTDGPRRSRSPPE